jgi:hypothetical protein
MCPEATLMRSVGTGRAVWPLWGEVVIKPCGDARDAGRAGVLTLLQRKRATVRVTLP